MKFVILSYLDVNGPRILFQDPGVIDDEVLDKIPPIMNIYKEEGFYIVPFSEYCSGNLIFSIPNPEHQPGSKELLQISVIITNGAIDGDFTKELLTGFKNAVQKIEELYKAFYIKTQKYVEAQEKFDALRNLLITFGKSFPKENVLKKTGSSTAKLFIFGLDHAGKTTIIKVLKGEEVNVNNLPPTLDVEISKFPIKDLCLIVYDAPGQTQFRDLWTPYLNIELRGLVFVLDLVHRIKYPQAKQLLFEIAADRNLLHLPLLIILNKTDLVQPNMDILVQELELNKLAQGRSVKWFQTSAIKKQNIFEAFSWLIEQIGKH